MPRTQPVRRYHQVDDLAGDPQTPAVSLHRLYARAEPDLDPRLDHPRRQRSQQVGAMQMPVRPAVPRLCRLAQRHPGHQPTAVMVAQFDRRRRARLGRHRIAQAKGLEHRDGVRPELDAGSDLAQTLGLLEYPDPSAPPRQRQSRGEAADAGPDHPDLAAP